MRAGAAADTASVATVSEENLKLLSERGRKAVENLMKFDSSHGSAQTHVYGDWPAAGTDDAHKQRLAEQVSSTHD